MDNVTHTLTGLMLARCGLDRGAKGTAAMMLLAANIPDIDIVSGLRGSLSYIQYHRAHTHSLLLAPLMALLPWLAVRLLARSRLGVVEYFGALIAVLSHLLLDFTNVYGIRILLPFSDRWLRLDMTDIVDPWILAILIAALGIPALVKLVSDEISGRRNPAPKRGWAVFALVALSMYEGARYFSHDRALGILNSHIYGGQPAERITALPDRVSPLRWRGVVEGEGFVYEVPVNVMAEYFDVGAGRIDYSPKNAPAMEVARRLPAFEIFGRFNQLPFWRLIPTEDGLRVELLDLRFGSLVRPGFEAVAEVEPNGHVKESRFVFAPPR